MENKHLIKQSSKLRRALIILLLTAVPTQWSMAQLTLAIQHSSLGKAIAQIQANSKYKFFYSDKLAATPVDGVDLESASLEEALNQLLKGKNISYRIEDNVVYLSEVGQAASVQQAADERTLTGTVVDSNKEPLIGVSVQVKGTTDGGITDMDGNYRVVTRKANPILVFSYVGYKTQEIAVKGNAPLSVTMEDDSQALDEVVVTALGIKREKKMLGYAVQEVKSDQLNQTGDPSVTSALEGKVAGLQMNTAGTGLGGSTKITIRGNSSLSDNNQPLWIVDGVPFSDNNNSSASYYGGVDRGGASVDINPDDIESISVLKGPNAAALYGSRAGNGVILVTTKKGSKKNGFGISYNGNFTWSTVAETLKMQERYGQGTNGVYDPTAGSSWGSELDGHKVTAWNGEERAYSKYGDKLKDFFDTGFAHTHNVSISNVTDKSHFRGSFGSSNNSGLFPNEKLNKINVDLNAGTTINKYLSMDGKVSLSRTKAEDRPQIGAYSVMAQLLGIPHNVDLNDLKQYSTADRAHVNWVGPTANQQNPYYVLNRFQNSDERWRAFGYYNAKINFTDWLHFSAKYSFDYYHTRIEDTNLSDGLNVSLANITSDTMNRQEQNFFEHNAEFLLSGDNHVGENFRIGYNAGANFMYQQFEQLGVGTKDMIAKGQWMLNTGKTLNTADQTGYRRATNSIFASAQLSWKEYLSLDLTARNDWSSTLPVKHNSFFYPSANLSFVITDFVRSLNKDVPSWLTFAKVRLSAAQAGKDTDPYNLQNTWGYSYSNGQLVINKSDVKKNAELKPEISTSYEAGLDMKFLNNRLGFDFTYYNSRTKNQVMKVPAAAPWSGGQLINTGLILNQGFELMVYATPVQTKDFRFDLNVNMSKNVSKVKDLPAGVPYIFFDGDVNFPINVGTRPGHRLGEIYAKSMYKRDEQGNVIINKQGRPTVVSGDDAFQYTLEHPIGNIEPDLLMSVAPSFSYKGFSLSALFDMKFGGNIVSVSESAATSAGLSEITANRGNADNNWTIVVPGKHADGSANTTPMRAQDYYTSLSMNAENFVYDASFIKLKELSFGYTFPRTLLKKTPLTALKLSFVARNLAYLMKHTPGTSPEGGYDTNMFSQAIDFMSVPYTRTFGFSINVGF
ncbi:MAG: SusC/RagA family TonB-linked outer membrane protein [Mediterranea sp.]|jgi:TonB-linked SusC/RagA family outer membrane protein|nr:SusC/RagA family TonB-linked outer membrane protein [Mediterranea sp.]